MAQRAFFLNTLQEGVTLEDYEQWLREVDYPFARAQATIKRYDVTRIDGNLFGTEGDAPCQYLEVVDITNVEDYEKGAAGAEFEAFLKDWQTYVAESTMVWGEVIE
jgi:hypothetical protein